MVGVMAVGGEVRSGAYRLGERITGKGAHFSHPPKPLQPLPQDLYPHLTTTPLVESPSLNNKSLNGVDISSVEFMHRGGGKIRVTVGQDL